MDCVINNDVASGLGSEGNNIVDEADFTHGRGRECQITVRSLIINNLTKRSTFITSRIPGSAEVLNDINNGKIVRDYILICRRCGRTRDVKLSSIKAVGKHTDRDTVSFQAQVIEHVSS